MRHPLVTVLAVSTITVASAGAAFAGQQTALEMEQKVAAAQLAEPRLDAGMTIAAASFKAAPLRNVLDTIAKAGEIRLRYDPDLKHLDATVDADFPSTTVEEALLNVAKIHGLVVRPTGRKSAILHASTPSKRAEYTDSVRTFEIKKADLRVLFTLLNQELAKETALLRPILVTGKESRTIMVRASAALMPKIEKLIADNDK